jgi:outer membrane receptor for ferrienterochelin and colicin
MRKKIKFLLCVFMMLVTASINAQVTTSAISGKVVDEKNDPAIGATVVAVHQPSGSSYNAVTNSDGRYTIQGMRTGGPYKVEISYIGYQKTTYSGAYLELGNTFTLDTQLKPSSLVLNEVVITGVASSKLMTGAGQNFSTSKIQNTPTVDRNIYDVVKNMPMAQINKIGGISFAGSNNRYNSFQIDGTVSNDVFGLTSSGTNGGQTGANPISMDAIQEIQVVISPFDVRQSGFTGGGINAITKQGTNEFHGSIYSYYNNQNLYGRYNAANSYANEKLNKQHTTTLGGSIGGPIIKDKLFFFGNVESINETYPSQYYPGSVTGGLTSAMAKSVADAYSKYTGISESYGSRDVAQKSLSVLARIDWNINNNNKFAFRYQHNNSLSDIYSPSSNTYYFENSGYTMKNNTNSFVAELNSHINNVLYNELRASMTTVRDHREVAYEAPCVSIKSAADDNYVAINIGTENSSGANILNQNIYSFEDNLSWYKGAHTLTFGTHNEIFHMENLFVQSNNGKWVYNSIADFLAGNSSQFVYKYADPADFIPKFNAGQFGFYAQDKWNFNNDLSFTLGLRLDIPKVFNNPTTNETFNSYAAGKNLDAVVGRMPSTKFMLSPRFGFRWYLDEAHNTLLRGGLGLFTGRVPFVWLSNVFTNDGVEQKGTTINSSSSAYAPSLATYAKNPAGAAATGSSAKPDICTVSKNFKYPQVFRVDFAIEQKLPYDIKMTLEGLYSKTLNNIYFKNLALTTNTTNAKTYAVSGVENSAVPNYTVASSNYYSIIDLENTSKGYTYSLSAQLEKTFDCGLNTSVSYTYGHSKSIFDGTSSVAYSNWIYNYASDSNNPSLSYSTFDIPNRLVASIGYSTPKYLKGLFNTDISLIYTGSNGMRYSLTMNETADYNGDGQKGNSLLYIPTEAELANMTFTAEESRTNFGNWIESNTYAKNHRGQYSERNCCQAPWENHFDLHLGENIYLLKSNGTKLQLTCDIINFGNLLNKNWGDNYASTYNVMPLQVNKVTNGVASFVYNSNNTVKLSNISSRWHAQLGVKLIF